MLLKSTLNISKTLVNTKWMNFKLTLFFFFGNNKLTLISKAK